MRTVGEYLLQIGHRIRQAQDAACSSGRSADAVETVREIVELAKLAIRENAGTLAVDDPDEFIRTLIEYSPRPEHRPLGEHLLDIESPVLRYKAHRPQMNQPDSLPRARPVVAEVLLAAVVCLEQHGS